MNWPSVAQYVELCLGFALVAKLLSLRLHRVYGYFSILLIADISGSLVWALQVRTQGTPLQFDYRTAWLVERVTVWVFTLLTVYALLGAILAQLPGILKLSRRVLNYSFAGAIVIGLLTALPEYRAALSTQVLHGRLAHVISAAFIMDRVVASVALVALLFILLFLIWFPVDMSRNLAVFFSGFVVYFALKASLLVFVSVRSNADRSSLHAVSMASAILVSLIFAYWAFFITKAGEAAVARLQLARWRKRDEDLLVAQLEAMNASLLRAVRR
jgi:hypothetical protein